MKVCCCTLAGTKACELCSNNPDYIETNSTQVISTGSDKYWINYLKSLWPEKKV